MVLNIFFSKPKAICPVRTLLWVGVSCRADRVTAATGQLLSESGVQTDAKCLSHGGRWSKTVAVPKESNLRS